MGEAMAPRRAGKRRVGGRGDDGERPRMLGTPGTTKSWHMGIGFPGIKFGEAREPG